MALIPAAPGRWTQPMDPADLVDWIGDLRDPATPMLEPGEEVATWAVELTAEAAFAFLTIRQDGAYAPALIDNGRRARIFLEVPEANREDPVFDGGGITVGVRFTITTNATPPRRRQRTLTLEIAQQ